VTTRRAVRVTMANALRETFANRAGFITQVVTMIVNDLAWVMFWILFFDRVGEVRGWDTRGVLLLLAVLTTSGGIVTGFLSNARAIGRIVVAGEMDAALALPTPTLLHLLVRRVMPVNLGDIAFGIVMFVVACNPTPGRTAMFVLTVATSVVVLTGFWVAMGSLAFFGAREDAGDLGFHMMLLFGAYPVDIFGGSARLILHTVIPAAFVAAVPAKLIDNFDAGTAATFLLAAVVFAMLAVTLFQLGLRRYTSGAVWTRA
jgi:ABC-2 type transport system permease protein